MAIKFYKTKDPHGFLNNFKKSPFALYGHQWSNVETPYQFRKTLIPGEQKGFFEPLSPMEARDLGQKVTIRPDWDLIKLIVMYDCVYAKFSQNLDLQEQLFATGDEELIEDSPVDYYWGCGANGSGKNMLGKLLMFVRGELRDEKTT
jgi:ribA/ribD-fused uncharacterized protein